MIVENPEVMLEEEAHGLPQEAGEKSFFHWAFILNVHGDDGRQYWIDCNIANRWVTLHHVVILMRCPINSIMWLTRLQGDQEKEPHPLDLN